MLSRKEQERPGTLLPKEWREKVESALESIYQERSEKKGKKFEVYALTYSNEVYLSASLVDEEINEILPVTYIASADLEDSIDPTKTLEALVDSISVFFDTYFADPEWNEYIAAWTETTFKKKTFHYKVSRENIALSIQADQLLNQ